MRNIYCEGDIVSEYSVDVPEFYINKNFFVKHVCPPNDSLFDIQHWTNKPQKVLKSLIGQGFELQCHCDLDL